MPKILAPNTVVVINRTASPLDGLPVRIKGVASRHPENIFYIIQHVDGLSPLDGAYPCIVLTDSCLDTPASCPPN